MRRWVIFSIIAAFVLFQLYPLFGSRLVVWDEAVYLGMGKYLYSFGASGLWEPIRPVALPLLIGWAWKLSLPYILSATLIKFLFSLGAIYLTYLITLRLFNAKAAVLASLLLATSPAFFYFSSLIYTEIPSVFFVLAATYFFIRKKLWLAGSMAAVAMLFKFTNILLIGVFGMYFLASYFRKQPVSAQIFKIAVSFSATLLPFLIFNGIFYSGAVLKPFLLAEWHQSNPAKAVVGWLSNYLFYIIEMLRQHLALVFAAGVFIFWKKWLKDSGKSITALALLVYLAYFSYIVNKDVRFLLTFLPFACIFAAAAFFEAVDFLKPVKFALPVFAAFLLVSFAFSCYADYKSYSLRTHPDGKIMELYRSVSNLGIKGNVMTSDPVFAAYNNNLFIPYYDSSEGMPTELKPSWNMTANQVEAVIFSPEMLYCSQSDSACIGNREKLHSQIKSNYKPMFNGTYLGGIDYYIYISAS